jgi:xylulose-5-phosphate/fructose-6-phosphate phosphoketolase
VAQVRKRAKPQTGDKRIYGKQELKEKVIERKQYMAKYGEDLREGRDGRWGAGRGEVSARK